MERTTKYSMTLKIYIDDIDVTVEHYILHNTDTPKIWEKVRQDFSENKLSFLIKDFDQKKLREDTVSALDTIGFHSWATSTYGNNNQKYGGLSFVYNPNHIDSVVNEASTLGTPKAFAKDFFNYKNIKNIKNSYLDTYGFTEPTKLANYGYIKEFLTRGQRTLIRSRLGVIKAGIQNVFYDHYAWHVDESIYLNLRLNIPITTEPNYLFQMKNEEPYHLDIEEGQAYTWDTSIPHRVFHKGTTTKDRINFVLGYSPWFDMDKENRCWVQNDFYGKHPFQMLIDGDIFTGLELLKKR
jgi:hypothetical protein